MLHSPLDAQRLGISVVPQEIKLVEQLSVAENIYLGRPIMKRIFPLVNVVDWKMLNKKAQDHLELLGVALDKNMKVKNASVAQKQTVAICKALSYKSELIIMDEPSAILTDKELRVLYNILAKLKANGVTIIYISHRIEEVFLIADNFTVLRDGKHVATGDVRDTNKRQLISMMVGRELEQEYPKKKATITEKLLEVRNLTRQGVFTDINFFIRRGEILGIAGLVGSGRTEVARAIFRADRNVTGDIFLNGEKVRIKNVRDAISKRIAFLPEDRKQQGLLLHMKVSENISLAAIDKIRTGFVLSKNKERRYARSFIDSLRIVTPSEKQIVKYLSGGNQQKVVVAKWLMVDSDIILFDEPTRGIDVGAKVEIYR